MEKAAFILFYQNRPVSVIIGNINGTNIIHLLKSAILEEICGEKDGQFEIKFTIGDWGKSSILLVNYVQDGSLITDDNFSLVKTIIYE